MTTIERMPLRTDDESLVTALRAGDEAAFAWLVRTYHPALIRLVRSHVPSDAVAEEAAQDGWVAVLEGIGRFEGRSSLKTWIFRIFLNIARSRGKRERRSVPMSSLERTADQYGLEDWLHAGAPSKAVEWLGGGTSRWDRNPEDRAESREIRTVIAEVIAGLPVRQRDVIVLRDVAHLTSSEVCSLLGVTQGNQRILLHRARAKVRAALAPYLEDGVAEQAMVA